ncbi:DUF1919 domain-containing protein [Opitutales bacterium]|nr:DUF1919 domain-containing protein [Opitutales bacterium]
MIKSMLKKIDRRINRWKFKRSIYKLKDTEFCIVSSTCVGSRIYQILNRQYNTPFVGLRIQPACFAKLVANFETYMATELTFAKVSKYPNHPNSRRSDSPCPIGLLGGDVELQFIHYADEEEATEKWNKRKARMDYKKLYYILVIPDDCDQEIILQYTASEPQRKVCFHRQEELKMPSCIYIPSNNGHIGNFYSQYQRFVGRFDFAEWIINRNPGIGRQRKKVSTEKPVTYR